MFYDEGLRFSCARCSACCGKSPGFVYLSRADLTKLCRYFRILEPEFVSVYCRWVQHHGGSEVLCLKEKTNYDCILWQEGCGCSAYACRPVQCSTYPFWSWMLKDADTWNECGRDCPGMNRGRLWTKGEIEEQKALYDGISLIYRKKTDGA